MTAGCTCVCCILHRNTKYDGGGVYEATAERIKSVWLVHFCKECEQGALLDIKVGDASLVGDDSWFILSLVHTANI